MQQKLIIFLAALWSSCLAFSLPSSVDILDIMNRYTEEKISLESHEEIIEKADQQGTIILAANAGQQGEVLQLMDFGISPHQEMIDAKGNIYTVMNFAIAHKMNAVIDRLFKEDVDPNKGYPLYHSYLYDDQDTAQKLLDRGAAIIDVFLAIKPSEEPTEKEKQWLDFLSDHFTEADKFLLAIYDGDLKEVKTKMDQNVHANLQENLWDYLPSVLQLPMIELFFENNIDASGVKGKATLASLVDIIDDHQLNEQQTIQIYQILDKFLQADTDIMFGFARALEQQNSQLSQYFIENTKDTQAWDLLKSYPSFLYNGCYMQYISNAYEPLFRADLSEEWTEFVLDISKKLVEKGVSFKEVDKEQELLINISHCYKNAMPLAQFLIDQGARINGEFYVFSPLETAMEHSPAMVKLLLESGAGPLDSNTLLRTYEGSLNFEERKEILLAYVNAGYDINEKTYNPAFYEIIKDTREEEKTLDDIKPDIDLFLELGFDINLNFNGYGSMLSAETWQFQQSMAMEDAIYDSLSQEQQENFTHSRSLIKLLIERGSNVDTMHDEVRGSPLLNIAKAGDIELFTIALDQSSNPAQQKDMYGMTILHHAAAFADQKLLKGLVEMGLDINERADKIKIPYPIQQAIIHWNTDAVKFLIEQGADLSVLSSTGENLLHLAAETTEEIVQLLLASNCCDLSLKNQSGLRPVDKAATEEIIALLEP